MTFLDCSPSAAAGSGSRRGLMVLEVMLASLLLAAALVVLVPLLSTIGRTRLSAEKRIIGLAAAENVLEQVASRPWNELTAEAAAAVSLDQAVAAELPAAVLAVSVADAPGELPAKRIVITLSWRDVQGQPAAPIRLTGWVYQWEAQP